MYNEFFNELGIVDGNRKDFSRKQINFLEVFLDVTKIECWFQENDICGKVQL